MNNRCGRNISLIKQLDAISLVMLGFSLFLIVNAFFFLPDGDAYYYWSWGKHLALGYLDGPPLVAYWMRGMDFFLGNTRLVLSLYIVVSLLATAFFIFKIANLLSNNRQIGLVASLLWLISIPTQYTLLFRGGNYDNLEQLFWSASTYFVLDYLRRKSNKSLYFAGICVGLLLLSKYSGIILILGLLIFFIRSPEERIIFKNKHFYGAGLLAFLIFSPNFLWNAAHNWLTFSFQLHAHLDAKSPLLLMFKYIRDLISYYGYSFLLVAFLIVRTVFKCR